MADTALFQPMLAASEIPAIEQLRFPLMASFKLDGVRCSVHGSGAMSRTMIPFPNTYVQRYFSNRLSDLKGFDGEITVGGCTGDEVMYRTSGALQSDEGSPDFMFHVFECFDHEGTATERYKYLLNVVPDLTLNGQRVMLLEQHFILNAKQLSKLYDKALAAGYEGLILKNPAGLYKNGRSTVREGTLLKWKEFIMRECIILDVLQGSANTNKDVRSNTGHAKRSSAKAGKIAKDQVGSFLVRCLETGVEFKCSRGVLKEPELKGLWQVRDTLKGKIFTYKSQKSGVKDKPRFPGFHAWRAAWDYTKPVQLTSLETACK